MITSELIVDVEFLREVKRIDGINICTLIQGRSEDLFVWTSKSNRENKCSTTSCYCYVISGTRNVREIITLIKIREGNLIECMEV